MSEESQEFEESVIAIGEDDKRTPGHIISREGKYFFNDGENEVKLFSPKEGKEGKIIRASLGHEDGEVINFDYPKNESESEHHTSSNEDDDHNEENEYPEEEEDENDEEEENNGENQVSEKEEKQTNNFWMYDVSTHGSVFQTVSI